MFHVDTSKKLESMGILEECMATNYNDAKQRNNIEGRGAHVAHPGVRKRFRAPGAKDRVTERAATQPGTQGVYEKVLRDVQAVSNAGLLIAAQWMGAEVLQCVLELEENWGEGGTTSFAHLSGSVGFQTGATVHIDKNDISSAIWVALGAFDIFLPEAGVVLKVQDGDVLSFSAATMWHCMCGVPQEIVEDTPKYCNISLYTNRRQAADLVELRKRKKGPSQMPAKELQELCEYEQARHHRVMENFAKMRELGLLE